MRPGPTDALRALLHWCAPSQDRELSVYRPFRTRPLDAATAKLTLYGHAVRCGGVRVEDLLRRETRRARARAAHPAGEVRRLVSWAVFPMASADRRQHGPPGGCARRVHYVGISNNGRTPSQPSGIFPGRVMGIVNDSHGDRVLGPWKMGARHLNGR